MELQQVTKVAETLITQGVRKARYVTPTCRIGTAEELGLCIEKLAGDSVVIKNKSPIDEFMSYLKGYAEQGENFVPDLSNSNSPFVQYFKHRQEVCVPKVCKIFGKEIIKPAPPKIVMGDNNPIISLNSFVEYIINNPGNMTKNQFYEIVDEVAEKMPAYVKKRYPNLRPEIAENADKIYKWQMAVGQEGPGAIKGEIKYGAFFDKERKETALKEYIQFIEDITGKKVLVGSPTRMGFATSTVTIYNNPEMYKDVDYIIWGHGTGSSFADVNSPYAWRFTDNGKSVWEFIEKNVPKGKKVLVTSCEEDAEFWKSLDRIPKDYEGTKVETSLKRNFPEMYDKNGNYMSGVGNTVDATLCPNQGVKICESGRRQILGTREITNIDNDLEGFVAGVLGNIKKVDFCL